MLVCANIQSKFLATSHFINPNMLFGSGVWLLPAMKMHCVQFKLALVNKIQNKMANNGKSESGTINAEDKLH